MSTNLKNWQLIFATLYRSIFAHRQPPAPHHIGPYGGSLGICGKKISAATTRKKAQH